MYFSFVKCKYIDRLWFKLRQEIEHAREYLQEHKDELNLEEIIEIKYGIKKRSTLNFVLYKASEMCPKIKTLLCKQISKYKILISEREKRMKQLEKEKSENAILRNRIKSMNPMQDLEK